MTRAQHFGLPGVCTLQTGHARTRMELMTCARAASCWRSTRWKSRWRLSSATTSGEGGALWGRVLAGGAGVAMHGCLLDRSSWRPRHLCLHQRCIRLSLRQHSDCVKLYTQRASQRPASHPAPCSPAATAAAVFLVTHLDLAQVQQGTASVVCTRVHAG